MNKFKFFIKQNDKFGKLVLFEVFHKSNPKVYLLVNDKNLNYIYFETKKYGFKTTYLLTTTQEQLYTYRNTNADFNDVFVGKTYRLSIYKTHIEVEETDNKVNDLYYGSIDYYITSYKDLVGKLMRKRNFRFTSLLLYLSILLMFFASASLLITIKWIAYVLSSLFFIAAIILMYYGFYKYIIFRGNEDD